MKKFKKNILKKYSNEYLQAHHDMITNQYIIRHLENWRINWELFIIILSIYNSVQLPFDIAFAPPAFGDDFWTTMNDIIDYCFVIDIMFSFRTTY